MNTLQDRPTTKPFALFTGHEVVPRRALDAGPESTLRECFMAHILPELEDEDRAAATIKEYLTILNHWEHLTENPPVYLITRSVIKAFRTKLLETSYKRGKSHRKRSTSTVNKIMRTLAAAVAWLWPADRHNTGGLGYIDFFKWPVPLAKQKKLPFTFTRRQLSGLYQACDSCQPETIFRKSPLHDPTLWKTALVLALNVGPRTWDLFALKWEDIRFEDFKYGSIWFRSRKTAKLQRVPLNRVARQHLDYLRKLHPTATRVFPGFSKNKTFYATWSRICTAAGVVAPFEAFRKTCSTMHNDVERGVGAFITGHEVKGVNAESYDNPTKRVMRAIYRMKLPVGFRRGAKALSSVAAS